ncbi:MAG: hypothetical protein ACYC3I_02255 [Gemmataceae bacterium]
MSISRYCLLLPLLTILAAATPSEEATPGSGDAADLERNRHLLNKWKADPEHYARLRRDLRDFWALPKPRRQQIRQLDHAFHQLDAKMQKRLWKVAERYTAWLERLPREQRRQIEAATDTQERLQLIRTIRERQWVERLPRKVREELENLPAEARSAKAAQLREQEKQQRRLWKRPIAAGQRPK